MSKQDVDTALSDLEAALDIISANVVMPVSGGVYPFYQSARVDLRLARKALEQLHEHPYIEDKPQENYEPPSSCYCNATNHPPCGFCTREVPA